MPPSRGSPRDAITLAVARSPTIKIVCEPCGRRGRCNLEALIAAYGANAKLTDLPATLASCEKPRSAGIYDRCKAKYEGFSFRA